MLCQDLDMDTEPKDKRVPVMFSASEVQAVDAWRRLHEGFPSRSEAIRRLVATGLKAGGGATVVRSPAPDSPNDADK